VTGSYEPTVLGDRFGISPPPTILTRTASVVPIGFTRLRSDRAGQGRAKDVPAENAFSFHVALQSVSADLWIDGKHVLRSAARPGDTFLFDLSRNPVSELHTPFDILRFYISQASLDELANDRGIRRTTGFVSTCLGSPDRVMHGLAIALLNTVEHVNERNALFIDHIGLAFHAHVTEVYGNTAIPAGAASGQLAPWQLRRAVDFMLTHLDGDPTVMQLARECGLSSSHFARGFRQTTGISAHQWLIRKRVERARDLLLGGRLGLADIAVTCGFVDQSHFTRVFSRFEGQSPGKWRRVNGAPHR
jgi:AraC family transcriptional regulator